MTKEELLQKLSEIEWDDFECKAAQDKLLAWERLTKSKVEFSSDLISSTITYWIGEQVSGQVNFGDNETAVNPKDAIGEQPREQVGEQVQRLVNAIREDACSFADILKRLRLKGKRNVFMRYLSPAIEEGYVLRAYPDKPNHPKQRYYLSEKGLKLVK